MIVTIDGPAGTGKSSVARQLAARLGFDFLDTGAMYRGLAAYCLQRGTDPDDVAAVARIAETVDITMDDGRVVVGGDDVTDQLRTTETTEAASRVAQNTGVRSAMVRLQRGWAADRNVVSEGRDQGTVAFPHAECKFFLDADPVVRARRRWQELSEKGVRSTVDELLAEQAARDERDRSRAVAPLRPAADAERIDTTNLPLSAVIDRLEDRVRSCLEGTRAQSSSSAET